MTQLMTYKAHLRAILLLGLPLIGGHLAQFAIGLTDTIMIGRYGVPELAALTLATTVFAVLFLFGSGFAWAVMPMVATFVAIKDEVRVRRATRMGLWLSIATFAVMMPGMWYSEWLLVRLGQAPSVAADAQVYLRIAGWGLLPALAVMVLKNFLAALELTRAAFWITVVAAFANALANYALIFGNFGLPELGIRGAAIASLCAHSVTFAGVVIYSQVKLPHYALWQRFWRADSDMLRQVAALGLPIGLTTLAEVGLFAASAVLIGWLGTVPLAAHGIALQLATMPFMIHLGLANVATVRAGNALGRNDPAHLRRGAVVVLALSCVVACVTMLVFLGVPKPLVALFLSETDPDRAAILSLGALLLAMAALFQFVDAGQVLALGLLRGMHDTRWPMIMAAISYWGIGVPAAAGLGLSLGYGAVGVWLGLVVGLAVASVLLLWRFWGHSLPALERQALARGATDD